MAEGEMLDPRAIGLLSPSDPRHRALVEAVEKQLAERDGEAAAEPEVEPRVALREAITKHDAAERHLAQLVKALPEAEAAVMAARGNVELAKQSVEEAKAAAAAYASAKALGTAGTALPPPLRNARLRLADAEDALVIASTAAGDLSKQHEEARQAVSYAGSDVDDAVTSVVRSDPATEKLMEMFKGACRELADLRQTVELVASHFPQMERLSLLSERIEDTLPSERRAQWETAIAGLQENADAALPSI
jgi:hypothetical protein